MAVPKENLLSLGHLTGNERNTFTKQREHSLKKRPVLLQADFSTVQSRQHLRVMHLQQRWQELKERERTAQQHNRQLLQQFDKAQDTLREMLARNAAMKTIRMEYERYLEDSAPRWQQQFKEKTQAAQRKRMEEYLRLCLKNAEEEKMTKSSSDRPLLSQDLTKKPQDVSAPQQNNNQNSHQDYNQDVSSHLPYMQSSWLTHTQSQTSRPPIRVPCQPQSSCHVPPSYLPPPSGFPYRHQSQLHHLASTPNRHHPWPRQDSPGWAPPQPDSPWSWIAGAAGIPSVGSEALWGRLYMEEPPHERGAQAETSRAPSSRRERDGGSRSRNLSQELDIKPVRLSGDHAESSESGRDSSQASREKRKKREKRGKTQRTSSDRERCSSQETSSAVVIAGVAAARSSESDASSEKHITSVGGRTRRRSGGFGVGSPRMEKAGNERTRSEGDDSGSHKEESHSTGEESGSQTEESRSENAENPSPGDKSDSCREEESESVSIKIGNGAAEIEEQENISSTEESSAEEKDEEEDEHKKNLGEGDNDDGEEKENSQRDEEQEENNVEEDDDDDEVSARKTTTEEEEETGAEDELEDEGDDKDGLKNEDGENRKQGSASSQDEEVDEEESERDEDVEGSDEEEDEEGEEEGEQKRDEAGEPEEERDSDDSIISPQESRPRKIHIIPEEAAEDEDDDDDDNKKGNEPSSSDDDSNEFSEEDDVENLLAPQEPTKKKEVKDLKVDDNPKVTCDKVEIFRVEPDNSTKTDHQSDSDEFDHFYD